MSSVTDFREFPNFSPSEEEAAEASQCLSEPDPLDDLNLLTATQPTADTVVDTDFQKVLNEFAGWGKDTW